MPDHLRGLSWAVLFCSLWTPAAQAAPLTVDEAVERVRHAHPDVLASRAEAAAARAATKSARGHLLPTLHVSDKQLFSFTKSGGSGFAGPLLANVGTFAALGGGSAPADFSVNLLQLGAVQPLLGLFKGADAWRALGHQSQAAHLGARRRQEVVEAQVRTGFLQLFEAQALKDAAALAQTDLQEQAVVAAKKVDAGSLTQADVLRVRVAAATAAQQVIQAQAQVATLAAGLTALLGLDDTEGAVAFAPPDALLSDAAVPALEASRTGALAERLDLRQGAALAEASRRLAGAKKWALLPELSVQAAYIYSSFVPIRSTLPGGPAHVHAGVIGLTLDWPIWEWGSSWYAYKEAQAQAHAAAQRQQSARQAVKAEVAARHHALVAARAAIEVSALQVEAATEAYRVVRALSDAASATTTDLLDAQSALTAARSRHVQNRYQAAMAKIALDLASRAPEQDSGAHQHDPLASTVESPRK